MTHEQISKVIAFIFASVCYVAGLWDLVILLTTTKAPTVSQVCRDTVLRYPMAFAIAIFLIVHFCWRD